MLKKKKKQKSCGQWLHILFSVTGSCTFQFFRMQKREQSNDNKGEEGELAQRFKSEGMASIGGDYLFLCMKVKPFRAGTQTFCVLTCQEHQGVIMPDNHIEKILALVVTF